MFEKMKRIGVVIALACPPLLFACEDGGDDPLDGRVVQQPDMPSAADRALGPDQGPTVEMGSDMPAADTSVDGPLPDGNDADGQVTEAGLPDSSR